MDDVVYFGCTTSTFLHDVSWLSQYKVLALKKL